MTFLLTLLWTNATIDNRTPNEEVAKISDLGSCPSMQGMSVHGNYVYAHKINGSACAESVNGVKMSMIPQ